MENQKELDDALMGYHTPPKDEELKTPTKADLLYMINELTKHIEGLPDHAKKSPLNQLDYLSLIELIKLFILAKE